MNESQLYNNQAGQETLSDDELLAKAVLVAQKKIAEHGLIMAQGKHKTIFLDTVPPSNKSITVGDLAKAIRMSGCCVGQDELFEWMRENGYLMTNGVLRNMPKREYIDMELFEIEESAVENPDGSISITRSTKVTRKGQAYFIVKYTENMDRRNEKWMN